MKIQTPFRFDKQLFKDFKLEAKRNRRSLNNFVDYLLSKIIEIGPTRETIRAIEVAGTGKDFEKIENIDDFLKPSGITENLKN